MALSNDLISQFVKATKDKQDVKKETVVYGTIDRNDTDKVIIDGSNISTPVTKTVIAGITTKEDGTEEPDRVMVTIKNHAAMVTGNLSNPSARNGDTLKVLELEATNAKIEDLEALNAEVQGTLTATNADIKNLEAVDADIKGTLTAQDAKIRNLEAADVEITGRLTAAEADIDYLQALDIDVEKLNAAYAFVEDLEASHADVDYLVSTVAEIDTLIFGSAGGNTIQTAFANSVIAQLGDAQIKSAMIEDISASKITAGDIITNNVRVKSEDGSLIISDETIKIMEGDQTRVQIGKDASGDYSIVICDADGNVMFHEGGIKEAAIKEAIIRNDMVSDTANIHASKLDIDSLFEEINDSSNTIKSTKVYLDDKKQTLDVAFKSLTTDVSSQGQIISSQGTDISTIQGQISSKIWQQDINTAKNEMSTQYSTLEQEVDSFKSTVSETYATVSDLDNIQIGGRNLFGFNKKIRTTSPGNAENSQITLDKSRNGFYVTILSDTQPFTTLGRIENIGFNGVAGESYTFSGTVYANAENLNIFIDICDKGNIRCAIGTEPQKISFTAIPTDYYTSTRLNGFLDVSGSGTTMPAGTIIYFENVKIERGGYATDWTPAPEDIETQISATETLIEQTAADLTVLINSSAKTATNYLNFSSSGLVIGDLTAVTLGKNVLIDSDSVDIRNGNTTLASFGSDHLYLAKNSRDAKIDLCNGLAEMYHEIDAKGYSVFNIDTTYGLSYIKMSAPMSDLLVLENTNRTNGVIIKGMINGATVGGFGLLRDGNMVRYGSDADDDNPVQNIVLDTGNFLTEMDDGWHYTGGYGENFTQYNNEEYATARYRKIGGMVEIRGVMRPTTTIAGSSTQYELFTLPEGYRPDSYMYQRCQADSVRSWMLTISPSGVVSFSRYGNGTSYVDATTSAWLPFQVTYFVG